MIIAIDGPAASGKSTTAKLVAERLGFTYLDTGAMYRAVTLAVIRQGLNPNSSKGLNQVLQKIDLDLKPDNGGIKVIMNAENVTSQIRSLEVTAHVSAVSAQPQVREAMVAIQRKLGRRQDCVVEGRDIGTVVFPEAECKFFLVADDETRARRRLKDLEDLGETRSLKELIADIKSRDKKDSSRENSPLRKAKDALEVDTSTLSINQQVMLIVNEVKRFLNNKETKTP